MSTGQIVTIGTCVVGKFLIAGYPFFCISFLGALFGCETLSDGSDRSVRCATLAHIRAP